MIESLKTVVLVEIDEGNDYENTELDFSLEGDVVDVILDEERIFTTDWSGNLKPLFLRALEMWQTSGGKD